MVKRQRSIRCSPPTRSNIQALKSSTRQWPAVVAPRLVRCCKLVWQAAIRLTPGRVILAGKCSDSMWSQVIANRSPTSIRVTDGIKPFRKRLVDLMTKDGKIYGVLAGVHRGNDLWYNKKLLEKNGITVGDKMSFDEFFAACDKLKAAGIPALGVGDSGIWASAQLFENTLLGVIGGQGWIDLFSGKMKWDDPKVKQAMTYFAKMQDYLNPDHSALSWDQAIGALIEGKVAFSSMGDWADGEFIKANKKENVDFGWVSHPGTDGSFIIVSDGFTLAKGAPHRDATIAWLKSIGSKEAQEAFNPLKGSIPARTDVDKSKFDNYHQWSMKSFADGTLVPSVVHGEAAPAAFQQALNDAVTAFIVDKNVDNFSNALVQAAKESRGQQLSN